MPERDDEFPEIDPGEMNEVPNDAIDAGLLKATFNKASLFRGLSPEARAVLEGHTTQVNMHAGAVILREGIADQGLYISLGTDQQALRKGKQSLPPTTVRHGDVLGTYHTLLQETPVIGVRRYLAVGARPEDQVTAPYFRIAPEAFRILQGLETGAQDMENFLRNALIGGEHLDSTTVQTLMLLRRMTNNPSAAPVLRPSQTPIPHFGEKTIRHFSPGQELAVQNGVLQVLSQGRLEVVRNFDGNDLVVARMESSVDERRENRGVYFFERGAVGVTKVAAQIRGGEGGAFVTNIELDNLDAPSRVELLKHVLGSQRDKIETNLAWRAANMQGSTK